jgi:hypothetical protein
MSPQELLGKHGIELPFYKPDRYYTTCPQCSHSRSQAHQNNKVLGVTIEADGSVRWGCNHCGWTGAEKGNGGHRDELKAYVYRDVAGVVRFRKVRNQPGKTPRFWLERSDGNGGWRTGTKDVDTKIVYRADEVARAIAEGRVVACVEGEKDVDSLWAIGIAATCNAHGASEPGKKPKWTKAHSEQLVGADIIVFNDNDAAGYEHADTCCKLSLGIARRVRRLDLAPHWPAMPKGGDVSDWLAQGHGRDELDALIATAIDYFSEKTRITREAGAALLDDVRAFLLRFIAYPSEHAKVAHVLWIAHGHLMDAWESTPRIAFLSPEPASGKTRSMEVTELLVPDPVAAVNVTPAYLFRKVGGEDGPPTILFDEIDAVFGPKAKENEELRALLNSGHRRGAVAGRCVVRGRIVATEEISSYAAVALAGLGWLPDTILSRSIVIRMRRRAPDEVVESFRRRVHAPAGEALRRRLTDWAAVIRAEATEARPRMPDGVEDRNADIWEPLLAVADIAGGDWPTLARQAATALVAAAREIEPSLNIRLLADLQTIFGDREQLTTKTILAELCAIEDSPWSDLKGKPITDNQLARRLRQYGVKSKVIRVGDSTPRGYTRDDLRDVWRRYLPSPPDKPATDATAATSQAFQRDSVAAQEFEDAMDVFEAQQGGDGDVAPVAGCCGSSDARNHNGMGVVAHVAAVAPSPGNGREPGRVADDRGLSRYEIRELANWYIEEADRSRVGSDLDREALDGALQVALDGALRQRLAERGVFPEFIAVEFERVMQVVFPGSQAMEEPKP